MGRDSFAYMLQFLPLGDLAFTMPLVCKAWHGIVHGMALKHTMRGQDIWPVPKHALVHYWHGLDALQQQKLVVCAVQHSDLDTLCWVGPYWPKPTQKAMMEAAARVGNLAVFHLLMDQGCVFDRKAGNAAAACGHLHILQLLVDSACHWDNITCGAAAAGGHMHVLQWLHGKGAVLDKYIFRQAVRGGHLEVMQWLHAQGCPWDAQACSFAAKEGNLALLQWLQNNGCPWDECTCLWATINGHLAVLEWASFNGCPMDVEACKKRASNDEVLRWFEQL